LAVVQKLNKFIKYCTKIIVWVFVPTIYSEINYISFSFNIPINGRLLEGILYR